MMGRQATGREQLFCIWSPFHTVPYRSMNSAIVRPFSNCTWVIHITHLLSKDASIFKPLLAHHVSRLRYGANQEK